MKVMKKLSVFVFALFIVLSSTNKVNAYEGDVNLNTSIRLNYVLSESDDEDEKGDYVSLRDNLKNNAAVVSNQEIAVSKETYSEIMRIQTEEKEYSDAEIAKLDAMDPSSAEYATEEAAYTAKMNEYEAQIKEYIPKYNDSNWKELSLVDTTERANRYKATVSGENAYFVAWVKVTLNGVDYYNFSVSCLEQVTPPSYTCEIVDGKYYDKEGNETTKEGYSEACEKKVCRIVDGKYYDSEGNETTKEEYYKACPNPKTGRNVYYTYGIITVGAAFILYMFTRKIKKFSK